MKNQIQGLESDNHYLNDLLTSTREKLEKALAEVQLLKGDHKEVSVSEGTNTNEEQQQA